MDATQAYTDTIKYLAILYVFLNETFFDGQLKIPIITAENDDKDKTLGYFTQSAVFILPNGENAHQINLSAGRLNRPLIEIVETLLHEMVHQLASVQGIEDTSRNGKYHNKEFKRLAETHGLNVVKEKGIGWARTSLTAEAKEKIQVFLEENPPEHDLIYHVIFPKSVAPKTKRVKIYYVCPKCGQKVTGSKNKELNITCSDCNLPFEKVVVE